MKSPGNGGGVGEETPVDMLKSGETSKEDRKNSKSYLPMSQSSVATDWIPVESISVGH